MRQPTAPQPYCKLGRELHRKHPLPSIHSCTLVLCSWAHCTLLCSSCALVLLYSCILVLLYSCTLLRRPAASAPPPLRSFLLCFVPRRHSRPPPARPHAHRLASGPPPGAAAGPAGLGPAPAGARRARGGMQPCGRLSRHAHRPPAFAGAATPPPRPRLHAARCEAGGSGDARRPPAGTPLVAIAQRLRKCVEHDSAGLPAVLHGYFWKSLRPPHACGGVARRAHEPAGGSGGASAGLVRAAPPGDPSCQGRKPGCDRRVHAATDRQLPGRGGLFATTSSQLSRPGGAVAGARVLSERVSLTLCFRLDAAVCETLANRAPCSSSQCGTASWRTNSLTQPALTGDPCPSSCPANQSATLLRRP